MCPPGKPRRGTSWLERLVMPFGLVLAAAAGLDSAGAQDVAAPAIEATSAPTAPEVINLEVANPPTDRPVNTTDAPAIAGAVGSLPIVSEGVQSLPPEIQVVRFSGPEGAILEVLGPSPTPVSIGDGKGLATVGLKVGVAYRLRLSNLPNRPEVELFPIIELVGHLHRPAQIDPSRFPIRVSFEDEDLIEAVDRGRMVTQVVYLEDPELALPLDTVKDETPVVTVTPAEDPRQVAAALGRVMAIVRLGGRRPTPEEINLEMVGFAADGVVMACPFVGPTGHSCGLPCGPVCGTPPAPGRPWLPSDEYLCDGGDRANPVQFGGDGGLRGIDPRDAVIRFRGATLDEVRPQIEALRERMERNEISAEQFRIQADRIARSTERAEGRPRVLPTNVVCIYAPRFAAVRSSIGPDATVKVQGTDLARLAQREQMSAARQGPKRIAQRQNAEIGRHRSRASGLAGRVFAGESSELRVLSGYENSTVIAGNVLVQGPETSKTRQKPSTTQINALAARLDLEQKVAVTGIIEGAGQTVMTWTPLETVGVEVPPNKPGLAVIKRVDAEAAEPGDTVTYTIQYRNMGNTPISSVSVVDSLLPRLKYKPGSAQGPKGTVFTSAANQSGSTELRWDLPGVIAPGAEGVVSFQAIIR